tara:strand:+ start:1297 stop:2100 length:804 start_codon:yes stop_codon:yes gene_type:complete
MSNPFYLTGSQLYLGTLSQESGSYNELVNRSLEQLYYRSYNSGSIIESSSYYHYEQTSLTSGSRYYSGIGLVYSIPRTKFGDNIDPNSVVLIPSSSGASGRYVDEDYIAENYFEEGRGYYNLLNPIQDDGEGNLFISSSIYNRVGNVFYSHGVIVLTDEQVARYFLSKPACHLEWKTNYPIYTSNYNLNLKDYEFNLTYNPSAQKTGSDGKVSGELIDAVTGSEFNPYITTVGLYNDSNELIAAGKLSKPVFKPQDTEMTIKVKLDS